MASHSQTANHAGAIPPASPSSGHDDNESSSFIKTPKQLIMMVVLVLVVPILLSVMLAKFVVHGERFGAGSDAMTAESIESRIQPVAGFELRDASAPTVARSGEEVYKAVCSACHAAGVAGAPIHSDKAAWAPRIAAGLESLIHSALKGKGAMPAQGGGDYSDLEISKAVVYMANDAGATFDEPEAPEAANAEGEGEKTEGAAPEGEPKK